VQREEEREGEGGKSLDFSKGKYFWGF